MKSDVVGVVEAAYALDRNEDEWLAGVLGSAAPLLDRGRGVIAYTYDASDLDAVKTSYARSFGRNTQNAEGLVGVVAGAHTILSREQATKAYVEGGPLMTVSSAFDTVPTDLPGVGPYIASVASDFLVVLAQDPARQGIAFATPLGAVARPSAKDRRVWPRVCAHIAAGARIRRHLARTRDAAVLSPGGRVEHAEGDARTARVQDALRDAARRIDQARTRARRDPSLALDLWEGLIDGRWSLVDRFDRDGRRYLVARQNEPQVRDPRALSLRERQVLAYTALGHSQKLISYELGISASAVVAARSQAMRKLAIGTRADAVHLLFGAKATPTVAKKTKQKR
jgi:DNA-binding CsgD family transcriptional regulator